MGRKKATVGIDASSRACVPHLHEPSANPPKVTGDPEPPGGGEGAWGCPGSLAGLATPPAGLCLITVTDRWALSEEGAGEPARSTPAQQSSLIKN